MADRPYLVYPPRGTRVADHPGPEPATSAPGVPAAPGDTGVAPVVTYVYTESPPRGATTNSWTVPASSLSKFLRPRLIGKLLAALATLILAALLLGGIRLGGQSPAASAGGRTVKIEVPAHRRPGSGGFTLPGPLGNAERTVPLDTIWIVDGSLPSADLAAFSAQAPADVAYLDRFSLPGDRLGFTLQPHMLYQVRASQASLTATVIYPAGILTAEPAQPLRLPPVAPGHDRAIVVITSDPSRWLGNLPTEPTPPRPTTRSRPGQSRTYIVDLQPGSGQNSDPLSPSNTQPQQLTADPRVDGSLALALARAFVDATGASWPA